MIVRSLASLRRTAEKRPPGYLDDVLSDAIVDGDTVTLSDERYAELVQKYRGHTPGFIPPGTVRDTPPPPPPPAAGPGTELKKMLRRWLGVVATPNCPCNAHARQMDAWGPDECERRMDEIIGWLETEAGRRRLPFLRFAAEKMVRLAIARARKAAAQ